MGMGLPVVGLAAPVLVPAVVWGLTRGALAVHANRYLELGLGGAAARQLQAGVNWWCLVGLAASAVPVGVALVLARRRPAVPRWLAARLGRPAAWAVVAAIAAVAAVNAAAWTVSGPRPTRPLNVVWITWDSTRADHCSAYGYGRPTTPHLDALAAEAVLFERAVAQHNWTFPSYATMLTSRYYWEFPGRTLDPPLVTVAEILQSSGYQTVGYVQNPNLDPELRFDQGFDTYVRLGRRTDTADMTRAARARVAELGGGRTPFFLFIHFQGPHWPYRPLPRFAAQFVAAAAPLLTEGETLTLMRSHGESWDRAAPDAAARLRYLEDMYDASIRTTDEALGDVLAALREHGLLERSIVVFNSDHGDEFQERGGFGHAHRNLHRELTAVPLVMRFPRALGIGPARIGAPVENVDVVPTLLDALGIPAPVALAGRSLLQLEPGGTGSRLATSHLHGLLALRTERFALFADFEHGPRFALHDLAADPEEQRPIAAPEASPAFRRLKAAAEAWHTRYRTWTESPSPAVGTGVSDELTRALRELGYVR